MSEEPIAILVGDLHFQDTTPSCRKDEYLKTLRDKMFFIKKTAKEFGGIPVPVGVAYVFDEEKVRLFESRCGLCGKSLWSQENATAFCNCMCFDAGDRHKSSLWRLSRMKCPQGVVMVVGEFAV